MDEVVTSSNAQRKASAAVEMEVDLAESLKGPNDKPTSARSASEETSDSRRTHVAAIRAAIVMAETVQISGEAKEAATVRLRIWRAHHCARLANQLRGPTEVENADALEMLRGEGEVGEAKTQFAHDSPALASFLKDPTLPASDIDGLTSMLAELAAQE